MLSKFSNGFEGIKITLQICEEIWDLSMRKNEIKSVEAFIELLITANVLNSSLYDLNGGHIYRLEFLIILTLFYIYRKEKFTTLMCVSMLRKRREIDEEIIVGSRF